MAFGITREELSSWKTKVLQGEIAFLTHYWYDPRFPHFKTVTKVGCVNLEKLMAWGKQYSIPANYIDKRSDFPHFDLLGEKQVEILTHEDKLDQLLRFKR